jgi:hypothetical protein
MKRVVGRDSNLDKKCYPLSIPLPFEAVSQCSGAIHRTQYVMSDKSDRYSMLCGSFKKQDYDTVCLGGG